MFSFARSRVLPFSPSLLSRARVRPAHRASAPFLFEPFQLLIRSHPHPHLPLSLSLPVTSPPPNNKIKPKNSAATNVELDDSASLPEGVALAAGAQTTAVFKKVDAGASVEFSYDIVPSVGGKAVQLPRASVAYTASDGGKPVKRTGLSSSPVIYVETPLELAFRHALTAGSYATLGVVRSPEQWKSIAVILGFVGVVFGGSTVLGKGKEAAAAARRSKALAALESDKTK